MAEVNFGGGDKDKNIFNRALGAVPKPIRQVANVGLDVLDTPRAFVVSTVKETRDLVEGRNFSFNDLIKQTSSNISAYEGLGLDRIGGPSWFGPALGLAADLVLGAATTPGIGTVSAGKTGAARAAKLSSGTLARNAVEVNRARVAKTVLDEIATPGSQLSQAGIDFRRASQAIRTTTPTATAGQIEQAAARAATLADVDYQKGLQVAAKLLVQGQSKMTGAEMAIADRARRIVIGKRSIPGTEKIADSISQAVGSLIPKEFVVRKVTKRMDPVTRSRKAATLAQRLDSFGMTGSRLRDSALDAIAPGGDTTRLAGQLEAAALRSKGLGAASLRARESIQGRDPGANAAARVVNASQNAATSGLRQDILDTYLGGTGSVNKALADLRKAPDRGAFEMKGAVDRVIKGKPGVGGKMDILVAKTLASVRGLDEQFFLENPAHWDRAEEALVERLEMFTKQVATDATYGPLKQGKRMLSGQRDVVSSVLAPWAGDVAKGLGASKIADPEALIRMAIATDPQVIANGAKTIKLGQGFEITEDLLARVTGTYGKTGQDEIAKFTRHFQGVTNMFRAAALMSPAFSNRNFIGGLLNNYANGVTLRNARWSTKQYRHFSVATDVNATPALRAAARAKIDPDFLDVMEFQGDTLSSLTKGVETDDFAGRIRKGAQYAQQRFDKTGLSARGVLTGTVDIKAPVEVVLRGAAYKRGLEMGLSKVASWAWTQKIHIDYQDLSSFDIGLRRVAPFSMWATRNPGLQMEYLARGMGTGGPLEAAMLNAQQREEGSAFPPFLQGSNFALGGGDVLNLSAAPSTDIFSTLDGKKNLADIARAYLAQTTPPIQAGLEAIAGHELDTGRKPNNWQRAAGFIPPLNTLAALTGQPSALRSKSQLPGWQGRLAAAGLPVSVRRYNS